MRQGVGLARTCSGDDKEWRPRRAILLANAMLDSPPLLRIEGFKVSGGDGHGSNHPSGQKTRPQIPVLFAMASPTFLCGIAWDAKRSRLTLASALEQIKNISAGR